MILTLAHVRRTANDGRMLRRRALVGAWLVLCLLLAQWVGYAHAIAHWHGQGSAAAHLQKSERGADVAASVFDHQKASGTCVALDAATLGAGLCSSGLALLAVPAPQQPPAMPAGPRWLPAFSPLFSTRAPPLDA